MRRAWRCLRGYGVTRARRRSPTRTARRCFAGGWLLAMWVTSETCLPRSFGGEAARFANLHPSALPPIESVLQGYPGEETWRYIPLGYHPAEWMTARCTETETRHRFAYHGTSGYSASFILATGMICPSESKPGEVFKGAAGSGVGGYDRGVYTTFSFTRADKHTPRLTSTHPRQPV